MVTNDEISRMLEAKRRGKDPRLELEKIRGSDSLKNLNLNMCPNCNNQNSKDACFCMECGEKLTPGEKIEFNQVTKPSIPDSNKTERIQHNHITKSNNFTSTKNDGGFFAPEKKGIEMGVIGGILMMGIAAIWFFGGLACDRVFFYPPILFIIGLYAFFKGLTKGNISGEKRN